MEKIKGSCLCQEVEYEVTGEAKAFFLCHCSRCRKVSGSAHASNLFFRIESFSWLKGESELRQIVVEGTRFGKTFCKICSSAMPRAQQDEYLLIPAGSIDGDIACKPLAHIHCSSRANWDDGFGRIPEFEGLPDQ